MLVFDSLVSLIEKIADDDAITFHQERCLNSRFRAVDCSLCADACPAEDAIAVTDGKPNFDSELCLHCGLCLHRCPTNAFTRIDNWASKLIQMVQALPVGAVDLVCPQHPLPQKGPAPLGVKTQRCLAALSPATLLEMSASEREVWLDDTHCVDCPLAYMHTAIQVTVARTNDWIALLPEDVPIRLRSQELGEAILTNQRPVYNAAMSPVSRRGLLTSFRQAGQKAAAPEEIIEMVKSGRTVPASERLPQGLPRQHAKIISLLEQRSSTEAPLAAPAGFDLHVDETRCTACTLCAKFCPTGALEYASNGESFDLTVQPSLCLGLDCNICVLACPDEAVSMPPPGESHDLLARTSLLDGHLASCQHCQQPIRDGLDLPDTCFACRPKRDLFGTAPLERLWGQRPDDER